MNEEQYKLLFNRRVNFDQRVWQTPSLAVAAEAFLLPSALKTDVQPLVAAGLAILSIILSLAAWQLMAKLRQLEIEDAERLRLFEQQTEGYTVLHGQLGPPEGVRRSWLTRRRSYYVWRSILWVFLAAGIAASIRPIVMLIGSAGLWCSQ